MKPPRVVMGMPLYNNAAKLPEALESLLGQTFADFAIVAIDDGSFDATPEIMAHYATLDPRISYERNDHRLGMIDNWRRTFQRGRDLHPDTLYFVWVSDHDTWHPHWLAGLVSALDQHPNAVLAYPRALGVGDDGEVLAKPTDFSTVGMTDPWSRARASWYGMSAGYMVYGLHRASALASAGVYHHVREPDRMLLYDLALRGEFVQTEGVHFLRRRTRAKPTTARQRKAFFPEGAPLRWFVPWPITHSALLLRGTPDVPRSRTRHDAARAAANYFVLAARLEARRRMKQLIGKTTKRTLKRFLKRAEGLGRDFAALVSSRPR